MATVASASADRRHPGRIRELRPRQRRRVGPHHLVAVHVGLGVPWLRHVLTVFDRRSVFCESDSHFLPRRSRVAPREWGRTDRRPPGSARDRNRQAVVDAAFALIVEGKGAPSAEAVAERAGVSASSIFRNFDGLADLQEQALDQFREALLTPPARHAVGRRRPRRPRRVLRAQSTRPLRAGAPADVDGTRPGVRARHARRGRRPQPCRPSPTRPGPASAARSTGLTPSDAADLIAVLDSLTSPEAFELMTRAHARTHQQIASAWTAGLLALIDDWLHQGSDPWCNAGTNEGEAMTRASRFEGTIGRTLADSEAVVRRAAAPRRRRAERRDRAARRHRLRPVRLLRLRHRHAQRRRARRRRAAVHQLPRHAAVLADPGLAAHRPIPARRRHARGVELPHRVPQQLGHISNHAATVAEVLRDEGYATFCVGKWHLAPMEQCSAAGPFDQWPLARGFDRFYGFLEGETDQFHPDLVVRQPPDRAAGRSPEDGYHLSEDLVDQLLADDRRQQGRPARPPVLRLPAVRCDPRPAPGAAPTTSRSTGAGSTRAGTSCASAGSNASSSSASIPEGTAARAAQPRRRRLGRPAREPAASSPAACRRRSPRSSTTPTTRSAASSTGCATMGQLDDTILVVLADNGASPGGRPVRRHARDEVLQRHLRDARRGDRPHRRHRRPAQPHQLPVGLGAVRQHPVQVVQAEHPRGRCPRADDRALPHGIVPTDQAGTKRNQFVNVVRHRADDLRPGRRRRRPRSYRGVEQLPVTGHSFASVLDDRGGAGDQHAAVLRDGRQPSARGPRRRRVEGGVQARPGCRLRHRAVGAVPPRRRLVGVPRPRRRPNPSGSPS